MIDTTILRDIPVFAGLTDPELEAVAKIATVRRFHKGDMLFEKGEPRKTFLILLGGEAHVYRIFNDEMQTLAILDQYNFAVESALGHRQQKHDHNGEMTNSGDVMQIDGKDFQSFAGDYPQVAQKIYANIVANLTDRLHHANNKLVTLYSTGKIASTYSDLDHLTELIFDTILKVIKARKAIFALFHPDQGMATIQTARGYKNNQALLNQEIKLFQDPILGQIYQTRQPVSIGRDTYQKQKGLHTAYASPSMVGTPLLIGERVVGAILLGDKENEQDFSYNNQLLLDVIGRQIAIPIALAESAEAERPEA